MDTNFYALSGYNHRTFLIIKAARRIGKERLQMLGKIAESAFGQQGKMRYLADSFISIYHKTSLPNK